MKDSWLATTRVRGLSKASRSPLTRTRNSSFMTTRRMDFSMVAVSVLNGR